MPFDRVLQTHQSGFGGIFHVRETRQVCWADRQSRQGDRPPSVLGKGLYMQTNSGRDPLNTGHISVAPKCQILFVP